MSSTTKSHAPIEDAPTAPRQTGLHRKLQNKSTVAHDAGVARYFDEYVFKTKPEAERSVSFIFPGYDRSGRVDIVKAVRLRD